MTTHKGNVKTGHVRKLCLIWVIICGIKIDPIRALLETLGGGVHPAYQKPCAINDQNLWFSQFMTWRKSLFPIYYCCGFYSCAKRNLWSWWSYQWRWLSSFLYKKNISNSSRAKSAKIIPYVWPKWPTSIPYLWPKWLKNYALWGCTSVAHIRESPTGSNITWTMVY